MEKFEKYYRYFSSDLPIKKYFIVLIKGLVCIVLLLWSESCYCQDAETDSLLKVVNTGKDDSLKVNALNSLAAAANDKSLPDKTLEFANKARDLAVKINFKHGEAYAYKWIGIANNYKGNYYQALVNSNNSLNIFQTLGDKVGSANLLSNIGAFYGDKGEDSRAIEYYLKALDLAQQSGNKLRIESTLGNIGVVFAKNPATNDKALGYYLKALPYALEVNDSESIGILCTNIGEAYTATNEFDSANYYYEKALKILDGSSSAAFTYNDLGKMYSQKQDYASAGIYFDKAYSIAQANNSPFDETQSLIGKAQLQSTLNKTQAAIKLFSQALRIAQPNGFNPELKQIYEGLASAYKETGDYKNSLSFQSLLNQLYSNENAQRLSFNTATLEYTMELQKQSAQIAVLKQENELQELNLAKEKLAKNASIIGLAIVLIFVIILLVNIRKRKRLNQLLSVQKGEIEAQKLSVEKALSDLKTTQTQLIQSEKMASLGDLTAGIAHEIQNPLNFINNFSDVNKELLSELREEAERCNIEGIKTIMNDLISNEDKINHHGKRADAIVKGMLQHSRKSSGRKEPTNINGLCEECLRLSYHGLRAKDKSFNAEFKTSFDNSIDKISVVSQDIVRVVLNLFSNAFYAVNEKKKTADKGYQPRVSVETKNLNGKVEIVIEDNGTGIPKSINEKIFQPFFTTKPAGKGTGLGLSLAYDIITKQHKGTIRAESKEGEGSRFIIQLPIS